MTPSPKWSENGRGVRGFGIESGLRWCGRVVLDDFVQQCQRPGGDLLHDLDPRTGKLVFLGIGAGRAGDGYDDAADRLGRPAAAERTCDTAFRERVVDVREGAEALSHGAHCLQADRAAGPKQFRVYASGFLLRAAAIADHAAVEP